MRQIVEREESEYMANTSQPKERERRQHEEFLQEWKRIE